MPPYKLVELTDDIFTSMEKEWKEYFGNDERKWFFEAYNNMLSAAKNWLDGIKNDSDEANDRWIYFALVDEKNNCFALTHVSHVLPKSQTSYYKFLSIRTHPKYDSRNILDDKLNINRIRESWTLLVYFLFAAIMLTIKSDNVIRIKLLANHQMDMPFISNFVTQLESDASITNKVVWDFVSISKYQRWLEIEKR